MIRRNNILRKTRLRSVSKKRSRELRTYAQKRKAFLAAHPFCQVVIQCHRLDEARVIADAGWVVAADGSCLDVVLRATEIHHKDKRHGARLNDESQWLAVSREAHRWIHEHPAEARARGWLV